VNPGDSNLRKGAAVDSRVKNFYALAEEFESVDTKEINPSWYELSNILQRYEFREDLAVGGMKEISRVYDARSKRYLAMARLKTAAPEDLYDPFIHEAWLTASLDHPNIITIHDVGVGEDERPYFTMDLKQGSSLDDVIAKIRSRDDEVMQAYTREELLAIFVKVCDAVAYAHSKNVIHLDLNPSNIQVGDFGEVLVCDWGLGRVLAGDDSLEFDRELLHPDLLDSVNLFREYKGTPGYMAPEQLESDEEISFTTDIYGLGGILYSLLTLERPISGEVETVLRQCREGDIVEPLRRAPHHNISESLNAVVMRSLSKDPEERYSSAEDLGDEVQRYLTGFATEAEEAGVLTQLKLFFQRNRKFCWTLVIFIGLASLGTFISFRALSEKERVATQARNLAEDQAERAVRSERLARKAQRQAEKHRGRTSVAKKEVEDTLQLYEAGLSELEKVNAKNQDSIIRIVHRFLNEGNIRKALHLLKTSLVDDPTNVTFLQELGILMFLNHKCDEAISYFEQTKYRGDIYQLAREFAEEKTDTKRFTVEQIVTAIERIKHEPYRLQLVVLDRVKRDSLHERASIIHAYLKSINPEWKDGWFEYNSSRASLRLGGKGLKNLEFGYSVLEGLRLRSLSVANSDVKALWRETRYPIETLDIRDTRVKSLWFTLRFNYLKFLIVEPGQFKAQQLGSLPERVKVIERPLDIGEERVHPPFQTPLL